MMYTRTTFLESSFNICHAMALFKPELPTVQQLHKSWRDLVLCSLIIQCESKQKVPLINIKNILLLFTDKIVIGH